MENKFQFSHIDHVEILTFDPSMEHFRKLMIENSLNSAATIREIIQNALDAKDPEKEGPVKVDFTVSEIETDQLKIPGIAEVFQHIKNLKPGNAYTEETVDHMKKQEMLKKVRVLTAEDSNTRGLTGADDMNGTYPVYAFNKGLHAEHDDSRTEKTRGGSHGVGKIANNAASDIHLMYFANCDEEGNQHIGGAVQLFDHMIDGQGYRGTGHYAGVDSERNLTAYTNHHPHPIFNKETRGLKIIIPYLRKELSDEKDLVKSIVNNFFVAIIDNKLEVTLEINGKAIEINNEGLDAVIDNYYPTELEKMKDDLLPLYVKTYRLAEPREFKVELYKKYNNETFNFQLYYFDDNEKIPTGRTAVIRSMGMKIEDKKVKGHVRTPYNAVLIGGAEEDEYLKTLENESHTVLSEESIRDPEEKGKAKNFINALERKLKETIEESQKEKIKTDGEIDTSSLIYDLNWQFEEQMEKNSKKVQITGDTRVVIQPEKERRDRGETGSTGQKKSSPTGRKRKARKKQPDPDREREVIEYVLAPEVVNRAVLEDEEYLSFNFNEVEGADKWEEFNLVMKMVNGNGDVLKEGFRLTDMYKSISLQNKVSLDFNASHIFDIPVSDGEVMLKMTKGMHYNPNLKFIYEVEVSQ